MAAQCGVCGTSSSVDHLALFVAALRAEDWPNMVSEARYVTSPAMLQELIGKLSRPEVLALAKGCRKQCTLKCKVGKISCRLRYVTLWGRYASALLSSACDD